MGELAEQCESVLQAYFLPIYLMLLQRDLGTEKGEKLTGWW